MPPSTILFVIMNKIHCENLEKNGRKDKRVQIKNRRYCYDCRLIIPSSGQSMLLVTQNEMLNLHTYPVLRPSQGTVHL